MVLLHIAHIETAVAGGVNIAVPKTVNAQKEFSAVGIINLTGEEIISVPTFSLEAFLDKKIPEPFQNPDLVVFHEVYRPAFLKLSRLLVKKKIPYIVIPHGCLTKTAQSKKFLKKRVANLFLFKPFLKKAKAIQYLSHKEQAESNFPYPSVVLPNGIDLPDVKKEASRSEETKLLYIGRLEWHIKGFDLLLGAVAQLKDFLIKTNTTLTIHGPKEDPSRKELQKLIDRYEIGDVVNLSGEVWGEDKKNTFLSSDYFIQTSRSEGMPMGLLEAMAHGLPVIVTEGTGFAQIASENQCGFGCKPTCEEIALAIKQAILAKEDYQALSEHARTLIQENYEEKAVSEKTVFAYQKLLG